jgi:mono/diheme cytochrome c family protein
LNPKGKNGGKQEIVIRRIRDFYGLSERDRISGMRLGILVVGALLVGLAAHAATPARIALEMQRSSPQDLEISGDVPGIPAGASRFLRYSDLSALPQVSFNVKDDSNFDGPVSLSGVPLDALLKVLGLTGSRQLIAALSSDGYEGHYTAEYRAQHHPFLVLKMGGKDPSQWARGADGEVFAPYFISHPSFTPASHVLAHVEQPQVPIGVVKLRFYDEDVALAPLKAGAATGPAAQGYRIAVQSCLRCHRAGDIGGSKSPFGWPQMALIAQGNASAFGKYIVQPNRVNPEATMPANPKYDAATVAAITAYFQAVK